MKTTDAVNDNYLDRVEGIAKRLGVVMLRRYRAEVDGFKFRRMRRLWRGYEAAHRASIALLDPFEVARTNSAAREALK